MLTIFRSALCSPLRFWSWRAFSIKYVFASLSTPLCRMVFPSLRGDFCRGLSKKLQAFFLRIITAFSLSKPAANTTREIFHAENKNKTRIFPPSASVFLKKDKASRGVVEDLHILINQIFLEFLVLRIVSSACCLGVKECCPATEAEATKKGLCCFLGHV